jgi:glycosyltransferase involved in cell wall biosynthesis
VKRVDLAIRALAETPAPTRLVVVGDGSQRQQLDALSRELGVSPRVEFVGSAGADRLIDLYANALAVLYVPFDEDYGYVTLEAFLSHKPVITATDSGGTLEFVRDGDNGFICDPSPAAIGAALARLASDQQLAPRLGASGFTRASAVTWDGVVEQLVG